MCPQSGIPRLGASLAALLLLWPLSFASANSRESAVRELAEKLSVQIKAQEGGDGKARIDDFQASNLFKSNPAPGVVVTLKKELDKLGCFNATSVLVVVGNIDSHEDQGGDVQILIQVRLKKNGRAVGKEIEASVNGTDAVRSIGSTFEPDPKLDPSKLKKSIEDASRSVIPAQNNNAVGDVVIVDNGQDNGGKKVQAREDGLFAMEIVKVQGDGKLPCPFKQYDVKAGNPLWFVELAKQDEFHVILHNKAPWEAVAILEIDGLNVLTACRNSNERGYVLAPGSSVVIKGWQLDEKKAATFKIVDMQESVVFQKEKLIGSFPPELGNITASFIRSWEKAPPGGSGLDNSPAVGKGTEVDMALQFVQRYLEPQPYSVMTVRYRH